MSVTDEKAGAPSAAAASSSASSNPSSGLASATAAMPTTAPSPAATESNTAGNADASATTTRTHAYSTPRRVSASGHSSSSASTPGISGILRRRKSAVLSTLEDIVGSVRRKSKAVIHWAETRRTELTRFLASVGITLATLFFTIIVNIIAHMRFPQDSPPLPDLGHDILPDLSHHPWIHLPDVILVTHIVVGVSTALMLKERFVILRRGLIIYSTLMFVRSLCILSTSLPEPCTHCRPECKNYRPEGLMAHMARVNAGLFPATTTCGDYLFSGHTVMMTMCTNIVSHYTSPERVTRRRLMWLFTFIGLLSIIATKLHYTIDVGIGLILTFQTWRFYHVHAEHNRQSITSMVMPPSSSFAPRGSRGAGKRGAAPMTAAAAADHDDDDEGEEQNDDDNNNNSNEASLAFGRGSSYGKRRSSSSNNSRGNNNSSSSSNAGDGPAPPSSPTSPLKSPTLSGYEEDEDNDDCGGQAEEDEDPAAANPEIVRARMNRLMSGAIL